jgi:hypothetical protein
MHTTVMLPMRSHDVYAKPLDTTTKKMNRLLQIGLILFTITSCSSQYQLKEELDYKDEKFEVGQIWNYETRTGEENSTIQIVKIDKYENQEAFIHISVKGLKMKNPSVEGGISKTIGHLAFARKSVIESVTKLVNPKEELSYSKERYQTWKKTFEADKAGVYIRSISEAVKYVETRMNQ